MISTRARIASTTMTLLVLFSSLSDTATAVSLGPEMLGGFQSGPSNGSLYAGGLHLDAEKDTVYMTGSHYDVDLIERDGGALATERTMQGKGNPPDGESSCFVTMLDMSRRDEEYELMAAEGVDADGYSYKFPPLTHWENYGDYEVMETCSAVTTDSLGRAYVVGSAERGSELQQDIDHPLIGFTAVLDKNNFELVSAAVAASTTEPDKHLLYPVAVLHSDLKEKNLFVAALTSTDAKEYPLGDQPDWQEKPKYGTSFYLSVMKFAVSDNDWTQPPMLEWISDFPVDEDSNGEQPLVFVAGMLLQKDANGVRHLIVAGSTRGTGQAYGDTVPGSDDEDGFILQLSPADGSFLMQHRHAGKQIVGTNNMREGTGSDDLIFGMCAASEGPSYTDEFYVVGATEGDMTTNEQGIQDELVAGFQTGPNVLNKYEKEHLWSSEGSLKPFLRRVSFQKGLGPVWTNQWAAMPSTETNMHLGGEGGGTNAYALDCVVDRESESVFVIGSVLNGAMMTQDDIELESFGGNDLWIAKVDEETGYVFWMTQLGNIGDERPALHKSIAINNYGNVVIYGDTTSSLYRERDSMESRTDMFVMIIDGETGAVSNDRDDDYKGGFSSTLVESHIPPIPDFGVDIDDDDDDIDDDDDYEDYDDVYLDDEPSNPSVIGESFDEIPSFDEEQSFDELELPSFDERPGFDEFEEPSFDEVPFIDDDDDDDDSVVVRESVEHGTMPPAMAPPESMHHSQSSDEYIVVDKLEVEMIIGVVLGVIVLLSCGCFICKRCKRRRLLKQVAKNRNLSPNGDGEGRDGVVGPIDLPLTLSSVNYKDKSSIDDGDKLGGGGEYKDNFDNNIDDEDLRVRLSKGEII